MAVDCSGRLPAAVFSGRRCLRCAVGLALAAIGAALAVWPASDVCASSCPRPRLLTVFPCGTRQGTTVDVEVYGDDLQEVTRLYFSHPGITAERLPDEAASPCGSR